MFIIFVVFYLFNRFLEYLMDSKINHDAGNLTRISRLKKQKQKTKRALNLYFSIYWFQEINK